MKSIYLFGLILIMSCHQGKSNKSKFHQSTVGKSIQTKVDSVGSLMNKSIIEGSIGVVSVVDNITEQDTIRFFDKEGSLWYEFSFFYDDSDGKFDYPNDNFKPLAFHPDNFLLALKVIDTTGNRYKVLINEKISIKKYLKRNQDFLLFQSWEEHILSVFSVGFDEVSNPLQESPLESSKKVYYDKDEFYHPSQIKGDWLQVKWGSEGDWEYGWIRWKDGEKLLVELYYFA